MTKEQFEEKYGKGIDVEVGGRKSNFSEEFVDADKISEAHVYRIRNKYYEICEPIKREIAEVSGLVEFCSPINNEGVEERGGHASGLAQFSKKDYEKCCPMVLREVKPCLTTDGSLTMARVIHPTVLTEKGMYTCKEGEIINGIAEDQFLITCIKGYRSDVIALKNISNGDILFSSQYPLFYHGDTLEFATYEGMDSHEGKVNSTKFTLDQVVAEVEKRAEANRNLEKYGVTVGEAKLISNSLSVENAKAAGKQAE